MEMALPFQRWNVRPEVQHIWMTNTGYLHSGEWKVKGWQLITNLICLSLNQQEQKWTRDISISGRKKGQSLFIRFPHVYIIVGIEHAVLKAGDTKVNYSKSKNQQSSSTQLRVTRMFFLSLLSRNLDNQLSSNFTQVYNFMHISILKQTVTGGFSKTNSTDPRQRVPLMY